MAVKIFILGRPGSGKSTIAQILEPIAKENGWSTRHFYDYKYLHDMFLQEEKDNVLDEDRSFRRKGPEACQGFDVREGRFKVLDTALKQMADEVRREELRYSEANKLLLLEFARKEYGPALHIFENDILQGSHLFYIKLGLEDCIERVKQRADEHRLRSEYDHFVSEDIMRSYYRTDDWLNGELQEYLAVLHRDGIYIKAEEINNMVPVDSLNRKAKELVEVRLTSGLVVV